MNTSTAITIAALAALTPTVTCLIGIILSRQDLRDFRAEVNKMNSDTNAKLEKLNSDTNAKLEKLNSDTNAKLEKLNSDTGAKLEKINVDLKQFYGMTTKLEGRVDEISKR